MNEMGEDQEKVKALLKWAVEQNLSGDPDRISRLYDEARRRWGHLMTRYSLGEIVVATLIEMEDGEKR